MLEEPLRVTDPRAVAIRATRDPPSRSTPRRECAEIVIAFFRDPHSVALKISLRTFAQGPRALSK
jgi:hypothetical protein